MSTVSKDQVVGINYKLTVDGQVVDQSQGQPLHYLHGANNIIPGLEEQLEGKKVGDKINVTIEPEKAYGQINPELVQEVSRNQFMGTDDIKPGMQFQAETQDGQIQIVTIKDVTDETVTVDANHPLAGHTLNFDVEVTDIRPATDEEKQHGHVHGSGTGEVQH